MYTTKKFSNLVIEQVKELKLDPLASQQTKKQVVPVGMCAPESGYICKETGDYRYHIPDRLSKAQGKKSYYIDNTNAHDTVEIQIMRPDPIDYLSMTNMQDLR